MSKELLEEIKEIYEMSKYDVNFFLGMGDIDWLIEQAERVQELEEDNKNLQVLSSINRKEHMRIHEQNKRYHEALETILYASATIYSHEMISAINKTALKALEGEE